MQTVIQVADELIVHCLDSADIKYWAYVPKGCGDHAKLLRGEATATVQEFDESTGKVTTTHTLTAAKVRQGVERMAAKYPHHMGDLLADNSDAETGDVLVQLALLGDIVYG